MVTENASLPNPAVVDPIYWPVKLLFSLSVDKLHDLARFSAGSLTTHRLFLGRCLLALRENKRFREFGCSSEIHYATSVLGLDSREARSSRRVASLLLDLPLITTASENGRISWAKLREITRKATPETEALWLVLAEKYNYRQLERLVSLTPKGGVPGDVMPGDEHASLELRLRVPELVFVLLERARRTASIKGDVAVSSAEVLELALSSYLAGTPLDKKARQRICDEANRDLQAERSRDLPMVEAAREVADDLGMLDDIDDGNDNDSEIGDALAIALDGEPMTDLDETDPNSKGDALGKGPARVVTSKQVLTDHSSWENTRLRFNPRNRHSTKAQKKELLRRHGWCCATPGCTHKVWLDLHHIVPYSQKGATDDKNQVPLCTSCHRNVHAGVLKIERAENGALVFSDANGRSLARQYTLEFATWLDRRLGWKGRVTDSHWAQAMAA